MSFTYDQLMAYQVPDVEHALGPDDCILYALSVGLGADPTDPRQLRFVYEDGLQALPMMANVLAFPGFWMQAPEAGIDWRKVLHGEQAFTIHQTIPVHGVFVAHTRIAGIADKGADKGAFVYVEREVVDKATGARICTLEQTNVLRGDGGCGGSDRPKRAAHVLPRSEPDVVCDLPTLPQSALLYRLNGDRNPLHASPEVAAAAGFAQPVLHGMCTMGYAGHAILRGVCDYAAARLRAMAVRFTAPVYPGETLRTEMWVQEDVVSFRTLALERDVVVLGNGRAELKAGFEFRV